MSSVILFFYTFSKKRRTSKKKKINKIAKEVKVVPSSASPDGGTMMSLLPTV